MKIAFLVHDYSRQGGHARYVAELTGQLKDYNEVHVFASFWEEPNPERIFFHRIFSWRKSALTTILSFCLPVTWAIRRKFDVIHSQGFTGFRQNVVTAHICHRAWYEAMEKHIGKLPLKKRINRWIVCALEGWLFRSRKAKAFIAVSKRTKNDLQRFHGITHCDVVYHGVDCEKFNPQNRIKYRSIFRSYLGLDPEEVLYLYVGDWQKAGLALVDALAKTPVGKLLVVSKTTQKIIERDAKNAGVSSRLIIIPGSKEIEKYYSVADIFVFPSFHDSFGMVVTEAMASGLPVICSGEAGASELISNDITGFVVDDPWDTLLLSNLMVQLAQDPKKREEIGKKARIQIEQYSWQRTAKLTMAIYQKISL